ncbi:MULTISPECIES: HepT-like ribonuclease domain-containing protein [Acidithrix]|uniref:HepT-like ribonuclease domain-containing protein n=1 Tax=Acidithrix TaxID=1609233 RepID=UPI0009E3AB9F|nr:MULTISPECIES: HepT-like ribonuclease domain-containing protein [Acidithrix]
MSVSICGDAQIGVIGEAVNGLSDEFRSERPEIPWRSIIGMCNILTHQYWDTS